MRSKLTMKEILFLFASAGLVIAPFLPLCMTEFRQGDLLNSSTYLFIDSKIGLLVPLISIVCFFVAAFKRKVRALPLIQLINSFAFIAGGILYVLYQWNSATARALTIAPLSAGDESPTFTFAILPGIYVAAAFALFLLVISVVCLFEKNRR